MNKTVGISTDQKFRNTYRRRRNRELEIPLEFKNRNFSSKLSNQIEDFEKEIQISNLITLEIESKNKTGIFL